MSGGAETAERAPTRGAATLGKTLRAVLVTPGDGFDLALSAADRRARMRVSLPEGLSPYVMAALGGVALMLLWLKFGAVVGGRSVAAADYGWSEILFALAMGAGLGLLGQALWGAAAGLPASRRGDEGEAARARRDARIVWGASAFPQVFGLLLLLPLDLLIVGPAIFASARPEDSLAMGWAAVSFALSTGLAFWSAVLFVRGTQVAGDLDVPRAAAASAGAALCLGAIVAAVAMLLVTVWG